MTLNVKVSPRQPGVFVVAPIGAIDAAGNPIFQERINTVVAQRPDVVIMDMEFTDYINSMGLRALFAAKKSLQAYGGKIVYMRLQPQIRKVFDILGALPSLKVFASVQELDSYLDAMQARSRAGTANDD
ncbi:MAG: STAS domain-containing protein [Desulfobacterales bacterium]|jgi:anti-anti-sigma factor|nr:STAS domain-containing protein [Desulfobacterales bacterium]